MIIELHMLQNFAPSCLNRDDTGTPKDCEFGGVRRARISSQCQKRAIRDYFRDQAILAPDDLAERSKRFIEHKFVPRLVEAGRTREQVEAVAKAAFGSVGLKAGDDLQTEYLLFLGNREVDNLITTIEQHWDDLSESAGTESDSGGGSARKKKSAAKKNVPKEVSTAVLNVLDGGRAADLALFGRMVADTPSVNVDAACQLAHAISTNRIAMEMDYYTAVDDLQMIESDEGTGAGMLGTVDFNSSCFYRYANIDLSQLLSNLQGDTDLAVRTLRAFIQASIEAIPTGRQNSFAAHNPPDFMMAVTRPRGQWNLANAFVRPVRAGQSTDLVEESVYRIGAYWSKLCRMFDAADINATYIWRDGEDIAGLNRSRVASVGEFIESVAAQLSFDDVPAGDGS